MTSPHWGSLVRSTYLGTYKSTVGRRASARREQASSHRKMAKEGFLGIAHSPAAEVTHAKA